MKQRIFLLIFSSVLLSFLAFSQEKCGSYKGYLQDDIKKYPEFYNSLDVGLGPILKNNAIKFLDSNGKLMITLAGAMSTAEIGKSLAPLIRAGKVHAITCTGANIEEDVFNDVRVVQVGHAQGEGVETSLVAINVNDLQNRAVTFRHIHAHFHRATFLAVGIE